MKRPLLPFPLLVLLLAGLVGLPLLLYGAYRGFTDAEAGENVPGVSWLPGSARNVSFYRSYSFTAYEFDIPEREFLNWAGGQGWEVRKVEGDPDPPSVLRYHFGGGRLSYPADLHPGATESEVEAWKEALRAYRSAREKRVERGYFYEHRQRNGGGVSVGYDLDAGRAYVQSSPR